MSRSRQSPPPSSVRTDPDRVPPWAVPIGPIGRTQLNISYGVFVAAGIVLTVVLISKGQPGNSDLPRSAAIGGAFWVVGWTIQAIAHTMIAWACGLRVPSLTLGLIGVETSPRPWSAAQTLILTFGTIVSLVALAIAFQLSVVWSDGGGWFPTLSIAAGDRGILAMPSLGMRSTDSMWRAVAWLCFVQAACQMFPLPRTLGRSMAAALVSMGARSMQLAAQVRLLRRSLIALAVLILGVAMLALSQEPINRFPRWPLLFVLSISLWVSSHRPDVWQMLSKFEQSRFEAATTVKPVRKSAISAARTAIRDRRNRKRLRRALERERGEAVDASRLDEILSRLHRDGAAALSDEDRKILTRVSDQLRKTRQSL